MLVVVSKDAVVVILRRQLVKMPLISASMDLLRASGVQGNSSLLSESWA